MTHEEHEAERKHQRKLQAQRDYVARNREKVYAAAAEYARTHRKERAAYYREYKRRIWGKTNDSRSDLS